MSLTPSNYFGTQKTDIYDPFSMDIWDPFLDLNFTIPSPYLPKEVVITRIDWKETPEAHVFKVDLPGLKKEEVKVEIKEGNVLQISGERSREEEEKNGIWHRVERGIGNFFRTFRLPGNSKTDQTKANMENGVLTVMVPKEEVKKPNVKPIEISG